MHCLTRAPEALEETRTPGNEWSHMIPEDNLSANQQGLAQWMRGVALWGLAAWV